MYTPYNSSWVNESRCFTQYSNYYKFARSIQISPVLPSFICCMESHFLSNFCILSGFHTEALYPPASQYNWSWLTWLNLRWLISLIVLFEQDICSHSKQPQMFEILRLTSQCNHSQSKCFQLSHHPVFSRPAPDSAGSGTGKKQIRQKLAFLFSFFTSKLSDLGNWNHIFSTCHGMMNEICCMREKLTHTFMDWINKMERHTKKQQQQKNAVGPSQPSTMYCIYIW